MFYVEGGGPLLDIAPYYLTAIVSVLGPIASVAAFTSTPSRERILGAGPRAGETITVMVPTHVAAVLHLAMGALATLTVSFEALGQYVSGLTVYGSEGSLLLPDANAFGGDVVLRHGRDEPVSVNYTSRGAQETRGLGLEELGEALQAGRAQSRAARSRSTSSMRPRRSVAPPSYGRPWTSPSPGIRLVVARQAVVR